MCSSLQKTAAVLKIYVITVASKEKYYIERNDTRSAQNSIRALRLK